MEIRFNHVSLLRAKVLHTVVNKNKNLWHFLSTVFSSNEFNILTFKTSF